MGIVVVGPWNNSEKDAVKTQQMPNDQAQYLEHPQTITDEVHELLKAALRSRPRQ